MGTNYSSTFKWDCAPTVRDDGCPGERPTAGGTCEGPLTCAYLDRSSCGWQFHTFIRRNARWMQAD